MTTKKMLLVKGVNLSAITCIIKGHSQLLSHAFVSLHEGNRTGTRLFECQADHLISSSSQVLVQSDLFKMAGRMIGHSFLHGGPPLTGVSPAVLHVLLGGSPEKATIVLEDVADIDIRETIQLVSLECKLCMSHEYTQACHHIHIPCLNMR